MPSNDKEYSKQYYAQNKQAWKDKYGNAKECEVCKCKATMMGQHLKTRKHLNNLALAAKPKQEAAEKTKMDEILQELNSLKEMLKQK